MKPTGPTLGDAGQYNHLPLPNGSTIGKTDNDSLRREFARLGIADAWTLGRDVLCRRYFEMLAKIGNEASDRAINEWLKEKRG